jgi:hypothetical protein
MHGAVQLFELLADIRSGRGISDVCVDLAEKCYADTHGLKIAVMNVGGDDGAAAGDFAADEFRRYLFALGDVFHFFGNHALAGKMHLREIPSSAIHRRRTLFNPGIAHRHVNLRVLVRTGLSIAKKDSLWHWLKDPATYPTPTNRGADTSWH